MTDELKHYVDVEVEYFNRLQLAEARAKELEGLCRIADARFFSYEQHIKKLEKFRDAVYGIVDGLDDPYVGDEWKDTPQEDCARELEHLRSVLVPLVRGEGP